MLKFNYCECGCRGWSANAGVLAYWVTDRGYADGKKGYVLHEGHGWMAPKIAGPFPSLGEACDAATAHALSTLAKIQSELA